MALGRFGCLSALVAGAVLGVGASAKQELYNAGDVTILAGTDLSGAKNDRSGAILVNHPGPFQAGSDSCTRLSETPWNPDTTDFESVLQHALSYQTYQDVFPEDQLYWIAALGASSCDKRHTTCRAIDGTGKVHEDVDCAKHLPILCTHTAPVSSSSLDDNAATWHVQQTVGSKVLTGYRDYHVWKFRGIRFADTPARFTYSHVADFDAGKKGEVVNATKAGADCSQPIGEVTSGSSEDCLFANVWTPYLPPSGAGEKGLVGKKQEGTTKLKPVMLYLYGGGFTSGSGKNTNTDGTNLAARGDVVVVSVNYRVGSIGFLNFNDGVHNGNYGLSDMVTALEWVHKYIRYFGGDPEQVTLFGESAGAASTHVLLGVAKAKGLFQRAALQSSPDGWPGPDPAGGIGLPYYDSLEHNYEVATKKVLKDAGCSDAEDEIECLSKLSGFDLVSLPTNANGFVVDGTYLTNHRLVVNSSADSLATDVSVLLGVNRDETGVYFPPAAYPPDNVTFIEYIDAVAAAVFGVVANISTHEYLNISNDHPLPGFPLSLFNDTASPATILDATVHLSTHWLFTCNTYAKAYSAAKHHAFQQTYFFEFNRTYSPRGYTQPWCDPPIRDNSTTSEYPYGDPTHDEYYKCHAGEQVYVFGTVLRAGMPERDGLDATFMKLVVDHWAAFARWGDPNPRADWLRARGPAYQETLEEVERVGEWKAVEADEPTMRVLQWGTDIFVMPLTSPTDASLAT
ncbi:Alpha/Beta hydrolase protein [Chaetomium sp. MPI-SDFR-AT-0129]|nr:Alpha/Beta hydrolase protein [Chaetomium sp. MPI-SDFR-AT-0129]